MMSLSTLNIACRNMGRNRKRTLLAVAAIALGQFTLVFVNCMMAGMYADMLRTMTGPLVGHVQIQHKDWREEQATDLALDNAKALRKAILGTPGVKNVSSRINAPVLVAYGKEGAQAMDAETGVIVGVDVAEESRAGGILESLDSELLPGRGAVVLGKNLARKLGVAPGEQIALIGQDVNEFPASDLFPVKAVIRSQLEVVGRWGVVMSLEDATRFLDMPDQVHRLIVRATDSRDAKGLAARLRALPVLKGAEVLSWQEAMPEFVTVMKMKDVSDLIFVIILFVAAAAGIANTMMMSVFERTNEFGMLLAVGTHPGRIVRMVMLESIVLGLTGVAIGSLIGSALVFWTSHTGIDYTALTTLSGQDVEFAFKGLNISYVLYPEFEWRHVIFGVGAVTITSVLASVWPAVMVSRLEPAEALRS